MTMLWSPEFERENRAVFYGMDADGKLDRELVWTSYLGCDDLTDSVHIDVVTDSRAVVMDILNHTHAVFRTEFGPLRTDDMPLRQERYIRSGNGDAEDALRFRPVKAVEADPRLLSSKMVELLRYVSEEQLARFGLEAMYKAVISRG